MIKLTRETRANVKIKEVLAMKKEMMNWAAKMMMQAHKDVIRYQAVLQQKKGMPPAKKNMLYGRYLKDMNEAI